ncbi:hypothetical protein Ahy_A02g008236 [Arachis hypogaea]|uniref:Transposase MuDR plant domain-containing protein n=1 Tax=Arachis hypogaea TaxID=3818 RepID=A0A445EDZ6_ARAHY|nr:hypothetical protein Ahy_A02g008236 [Arachis hypogaea]
MLYMPSQNFPLRSCRKICRHRFNRHNEVFEVREMPNGVEYTINHRHKVCGCAVYVHAIKKMNEICRVYWTEFVLVGDPSTWPPNIGPQLILNLASRRGGKGRPKSIYYLNEMDVHQMRGPRPCNLCRGKGHSHS